MCRCYNYFSVCLLFLIFYLNSSTYSYNIDTKHAIVYDKSDGSYFGYAVALAHTNQDTVLVLIGAPKGNYSKPGKAKFINTGVIYKCLPTNNSCKEQYIHTLRASVSSKDFQDMSNSWLGGTLDVNPNNSSYVTCSHRWKNDYTHSDFRKTLSMMGLCTAVSFDNTTYETKYDKDPDIVGLGTSVKYSQDGSKLIVGVPGYDDLPSGIILFPSNDLKTPLETMLNMTMRENSYAGYAVASGKFFSDNIEYFVMGVPRYDNGAVIIIDKSNRNIMLLTADDANSEFGSYFGATLCVVDVNHDGLDDLLVGSQMHPGKSTEEGKVFLYVSNGMELVFNQVISGSETERGQFGSAIANVNDIDQDGYTDIVIGAPYENNEGAIYIYNTNKDGFPKSYSQKITAGDVAMGTNMMGFGISISSAIDVNNDNYPDFLVGAYLSSQARLLMARPVLALGLDMLLKPEKINILTFNCPEHGNPAVCLLLELRLTYSNPTGKLPSEIEVNGTLLMEVSSQSESNGLQRALIVSGSDLVTSTPFNMRLTAGKALSETFKILIKDTEHIFEPIDVTFMIALAEKSCTICPILKKSTYKKQIPFELDCGGDSNCTTDLKLNASTEVKYLLIGKLQMFSFDIKVSNVQNHAYASFALINFPKYLQYNQVKTKKDLPKIECSSPSEDIVRCSLGNPLRKNDVASFSLEFTSDGTMNQSPISIQIEVITKSIESNKGDNTKTVTIPVHMQAVTTFNGDSSPSLLIAQKENRIVNHTFHISNEGPSPLLQVTMNITLPTLIKERPDLVERICKDSMATTCATSFYFGNISKGGTKEVKIVFAIKEKFFAEKTKYLETKAQLYRQNHPLYLLKEWSMEAKIKTLLKIEVEPVAGWIIAVSIIAGIAVVAILIVIFWKFGFFKRQRIPINGENETNPTDDQTSQANPSQQNSNPDNANTDKDEYDKIPADAF